MSDAPRFRIERVAAADVRPLRGAVLRPGVPPETLVYDGDDTPDAFHVGARDAAGDIHGIASLNREAAPGRPGVVAWRLRGMATTPALRHSGVGRRLLQACFRHVRASGGGLLWCNARVAALGFYAKLGLYTEGEEFDIPGIGPHYVMSRWLAHLRPARVEEAPVLGALAMRSKATWGYSPEFLARCEPELAVDEAQIRGGSRHYVVATVQDVLAGFHSVEPQMNGDVLLDALFVDPQWIGRGIGRELFEQAVGVALKLGAARLVAIADPNAAGFYARQGLRPDDVEPSTVDPDRPLPRFVLDLTSP